MNPEVLLYAALLMGVLYLAGVKVYSAGKQSVPVIKDPPKKTLEIPARPSREAATLAERFINEQEHVLDPDGEFNHVNCRACGPGPLGRHEVPVEYDHVFRKQVLYDDIGYGWSRKKMGVVGSPSEADVVTSQIEGTNMHTLMLDIDVPARMIPSSTPGCQHLYINVPMEWDKAEAVLKALRDAGVIEQGFYDSSMKNLAMHLRVPWKDKAE